MFARWAVVSCCPGALLVNHSKPGCSLYCFNSGGQSLPETTTLRSHAVLLLESCITQGFNLCPSWVKKACSPRPQLNGLTETGDHLNPRSSEPRLGIAPVQSDSRMEWRGLWRWVCRVKGRWCMWNDIPDAQALLFNEGNGRPPRQRRCQSVKWQRLRV